MQPVVLHIDVQNQSILDWLKENKFVVYSEIVRYSEKLIKDDLEMVQAILIANLSENIVFILKREDIEFTLEKAMKYFLSIEEYEQCSKIQELYILIDEKVKQNDSTIIKTH